MDKKFINAMKSLSLQAIYIAKQGHVGMSISASPITYSLYTKHINISSKQPKWFNRDRVVLSAGHGSLSIYSILCFAGLLDIEDIKKFKTKDSKTPGHPECEPNNFIDASTGPLGQGVAMAVGMAIAEKYLDNKFKSLKGLIDHYTYVILGDGDLQEGICYEAMSLAGKLKLGKIIFLHDSNNFQLDSSVFKVFNEDLKKRAESMNWFYLQVNNNQYEIDLAINQCKSQDLPSFIEIKTIIGEDTKFENSNKAHSMSLTQEDIEFSNKKLGTNYTNFEFEKDIYNHFNKCVVDRGNKKYDEWIKLCEKYKKENTVEFNKFNNYINNIFPDIINIIKNINFKDKNVATRNYVKDLLVTLNNHGSDWLISGCADLVAATNIQLGDSDFASNYKSNNILFGIREFAMSAITNGILLHSGLKTISGTFLVFSDYMKSAIRLGALMELPNIYIFTHDSYQVGGDGPTHQPVDQLAMLRAIPNVCVYKPCDEIEFSAALAESFSSTKITHIIILTRHSLSSSHNTSFEKTKKGGYVLLNVLNPDIVLVGSGSEIDLLFEIKELLNKDNISAKIVSAPSLTSMLSENESYLKELFNSKYGTFSVEASSDNTWYKLFKYSNNFYHLGTSKFGKSMDGNELYKLMGFNASNCFELIKKNLIK